MIENIAKPGVPNQSIGVFITPIFVNVQLINPEKGLYIQYQTKLLTIVGVIHGIKETPAITFLYFPKRSKAMAKGKPRHNEITTVATPNTMEFISTCQKMGECSQ